MYSELIRLLCELCFSNNWEKAVAPTQRLTFLGIEIDTVLRQFLFLYKDSFTRVFLLIQIFAQVNKSELSLIWMARTAEITCSCIIKMFN